MTILQTAQALFGDLSLVLIKEWEGLNGQMGVYHSPDHGYFSLLILIQAQGKHYSHSYLSTERDQALHNAELIAAFAGAQERLPFLKKEEGEHTPLKKVIYALPLFRTRSSHPLEQRGNPLCLFCLSSGLSTNNLRKGGNESSVNLSLHRKDL